MAETENTLWLSCISTYKFGAIKMYTVCRTHKQNVYSEACTGILKLRGLSDPAWITLREKMMQGQAMTSVTSASVST